MLVAVRVHRAGAFPVLWLQEGYAVPPFVPVVNLVHFIHRPNPQWFSIHDQLLVVHVKPGLAKRLNRLLVVRLLQR